MADDVFADFSVADFQATNFKTLFQHYSSSPTQRTGVIRYRSKMKSMASYNRLYLSLFLHRFCRKACFNLVSEVVDGLLSSLSVHIVSGMNARASENISPCQMR